MFDNLEIFENLSQQEKDNLSLFCQQRCLKPQEILFNEWDDATAIYIVVSWKLKAYKIRSEGELTLWYIERGEFVWEMAFFDGENIPKKRMASIKAIEDTELIVIMSYSITELANKRKDIYDKIISIIEERKLKNDLKS